MSSEINASADLIVASHYRGAIHAEKLSTQKSVPCLETVVNIVEKIKVIFHPGYFCASPVQDLREFTQKYLAEIHHDLSEQIALACQLENAKLREEYGIQFIKALPTIHNSLIADLQAAMDGDPAAKSFSEVILAYPGYEAVTHYRIAHALHNLKIPLLPRMITEHAHQKTGIDIHPGAQIKDGFFIDHGTGVVIGETAVIGANVKIYQGVTLGALSFAKDSFGRLIKNQKRHPTIEDDVVIYAGATILGGSTVIGKGSVIGGNTWITHSVAPNTKITNERTPA